MKEDVAWILKILNLNIKLKFWGSRSSFQEKILRNSLLENLPDNRIGWRSRTLRSRRRFNSLIHWAKGSVNVHPRGLVLVVLRPSDCYPRITPLALDYDPRILRILVALIHLAALTNCEFSFSRNVFFCYC